MRVERETRDMTNLRQKIADLECLVASKTEKVKFYADMAQSLVKATGEAIHEAEERGRVQEREACAQAICAGCREGEDLYRNAHGGFMHKHNTDSAWYGCAASAIRIRFTHDSREPGADSRERLTPVVGTSAPVSHYERLEGASA